MKAVKIKPGVYWVGAIDWNLRNFHGEEATKYYANTVLKYGP